MKKRYAFITLLLAVFTLSSAIVFSLLAQTYVPGGTGSADKYGSIAFSTSTRSYGYSYNYDNQQDAITRAMNECNSRTPSGDCIMLLWFRNACAALAIGDTGYGSAWAAERPAAEQSAIANCSAYSANCRIVQWVCTDRPSQ